LDCLEASYGAGGYLTGQIHTLNTLSMYGGLHELKSVKDIYEEKASHQSYGVRDEFRISGQAVNELIKCVDDSVRIYLCVFREIDRQTGFKQVLEFQATEPVLWIPSKLWFAFLSRCLTILNKTHERIYRIQPSNYGIISGLFAYLMQSVIFTPPKVNAYVRESLAVLQYQRHCNTFGMFFLDTLDLNNAACLIAKILPEDDASVHRILGPLVRKPRLSITRREDDEEDLTQYPIREMLTWTQITRSLEANPTILIRKGEGLPADLFQYGIAEEGSTEEMACNIFIKFTRQMWMALHEQWRIEATVDIAPRTIEEALTNWTVDFVLQHCINPMFSPCNTGLRNVTGRHVASFAERFKMYFPLEREGLGKFWSGFATEPGYIHEF
jgi:hypothetical protein